MEEVRHRFSADQTTRGVGVCAHSDFMAAGSQYDLQSVKNRAFTRPSGAKQEAPFVVQYLFDDSKCCIGQRRLRAAGDELVPLHFAGKCSLVKRMLRESAFRQSVPAQSKLGFEALPAKGRALLAEGNLMPRGLLELEHFCVRIVLVALLVAKRQEFKPSLRWTAVEEAVDLAAKRDDARHSGD